MAVEPFCTDSHGHNLLNKVRFRRTIETRWHRRRSSARRTPELVAAELLRGNYMYAQPQLRCTDFPSILQLRLVAFHWISIEQIESGILVQAALKTRAG